MGQGEVTGERRCWLLGTPALGWPGAGRGWPGLAAQGEGAAGFACTRNKMLMLMINVRLAADRVPRTVLLHMSLITLSTACEARRAGCYRHVLFMDEETEAQRS